MRRLDFRLAFLSAFLLTACTAQHAAGPRPTPTPTPLRNPLNVPLYAGAAVIAAQPLHQIVSTPQNRDSVFAGGAGTYDGEEVLAISNASFAKLSAWVRRLAAHPPAGYVPSSEISGTHAQTLAYGFDYAAFERGRGKATHGVLVIVMDPQRVNQQLGSVLDIIGKYRSLPAFMRGPIDDQVKQRLGITLSDAIQPASPIGASLAALDDFQRRNARGIILIDAVRR
jgi:hypothetical protein